MYYNSKLCRSPRELLPFRKLGNETVTSYLEALTEPSFGQDVKPQRAQRAQFALLLRDLCASVVFLFGTRTIGGVGWEKAVSGSFAKLL